MNRREYTEQNAYGPTVKHHTTLSAEHLSPPLCNEDNRLLSTDNRQSTCPSAREIFPLCIRLRLIGQDVSFTRGEFRYCLKIEHFIGHQITRFVALTLPLVFVIMISLTWLITVFKQAAHALSAQIVARG